MFEGTVLTGTKEMLNKTFIQFFLSCRPNFVQYNANLVAHKYNLTRKAFASHSFLKQKMSGIQILSVKNVRLLSLIQD